MLKHLQIVPPWEHPESKINFEIEQVVQKSWQRKVKVWQMGGFGEGEGWVCTRMVIYQEG